VPISLQTGLRVDEKNGDEWFLAIGRRGARGCPFRRKPEGLVNWGRVHIFLVAAVELLSIKKLAHFQCGTRNGDYGI